MNVFKVFQPNKVLQYFKDKVHLLVYWFNKHGEKLKICNIKG